MGGRKLVRGVDYSISYDLGQVTFLNPDALFGSGTAQVTARFEERGLFAVAPTTILGMATRYSLGERGAINLIGLYQREQSAFTRPALGFEASANLIGGVNTALHFKPDWLTRGLNSLVTSASTAPSLFDVNAEVAFTKPDPNRSGQAYLEEFEGEAGLQVPCARPQWEFGSRPQQATGLEDILGGGFDPDDAVALTWQNLVPGPGGSASELRPQDIDTLIRLRGPGPGAGNDHVSHAPCRHGGRHRAAEQFVPLVAPAARLPAALALDGDGAQHHGVDLTNDEYLEFWLFQPNGQPASAAGVRLVFDLGTVSEDAVAVAPDTFTVNGADTLYHGPAVRGPGPPRHRAHRHRDLQRRDRRRRHPG